MGPLLHSLFVLCLRLTPSHARPLHAPRTLLHDFEAGIEAGIQAANKERSWQYVPGGEFRGGAKGQPWLVREVIYDATIVKLTQPDDRELGMTISRFGVVMALQPKSQAAIAGIEVGHKLMAINGAPFTSAAPLYEIPVGDEMELSLEKTLGGEYVLTAECASNAATEARVMRAAQGRCSGRVMELEDFVPSTLLAPSGASKVQRLHWQHGISWDGHEYKHPARWTVATLTQLDDRTNLGVTISSDDVVTAVRRGSQAEIVGIEVGDRIMAVNGAPFTMAALVEIPVGDQMELSLQKALSPGQRPCMGSGGGLAAYVSPKMAGDLEEWIDHWAGDRRLESCRDNIFRQARNAVQCLHDVGWAHNDLRAANFLVDSFAGCPRLRISDFDSAQWIGGNDQTRAFYVRNDERQLKQMVERPYNSQVRTAQAAVRGHSAHVPVFDRGDYGGVGFERVRRGEASVSKGT